MALRRTAEFQNDKGIFYKLEIYDSLLPSASTNTLQLGSDGFTLSYEATDRTRFSGIIASNCSFDIIPRNSSEQAFIDDIAIAPYGRFQVKILKSSDGTNFNNYWVGNILSDVSSRQNLSFFAGTQQTVTATDGLAELVDVSTDFVFDDGSGGVSASSKRFINLILEILRDAQIFNTSQYWTTSEDFLQTQVNWYTGQMPTPAADKDPLFFSGIFANAIRIEENDELVFLNCFDVLDRIMKCWGARLMLSDGVWRMIQPNGYADTNFQRTYRKNTSTVISSGAVQLKTNAGVVLGGGSFDSLHPVQKTQMFYDFNFGQQLLQFDIPLWMTKVGPNLQKTDPPTTTVYGGNAATGNQTFSASIGIITAETGASLEWNLLFRPQLIYHDSSTGGYDIGSATAFTTSFNAFADSRTASGVQFNSPLKCLLHLRLKLVGDSGTTYFLNITEGANGSSHEWTTDLTTGVGIREIFSGNNFQDYYNPATSSYGLQPQSGTSTGGATLSAVPESGELFIEGFSRFHWHDLQGAFVATTDEIDTADDLFPTSSGTIIRGLAVGMAAPDGTDYFLRYLVGGQSTTQQLVTATQGTDVSNAVLEIEPTNLGSGPTAQSPTRILTFDASGNGDDGTNVTWQVFQETTGDGITGSITKILCKEVLAGRKGGIDVYNGSIQTNTATNYEFHLAFDNILFTKIFVPNELSYQANEGIWEGQWIETDLDASGQSYSVNNIVLNTTANPTFTTQW